MRVVALVDPDEAAVRRARDLSPSLAAVPAQSELAPLVERPDDIDAVLIATPHAAHVSQIEASFAVGWHVMVDKPLCTSVEEALRAIRARDRSGKVGLLSYQRHYQGEFLRLREEVLSGRYGKVQFFSGLLVQNWKAFTIGTWRQDPDLGGGGMLIDSGSHLLDALLWCTDSRAECVSCWLDHRGTPVDIDATLNVRLFGGAIGNLSLVGDGPRWREELTIWLDRASFTIRDGKLFALHADGSRLYFEDLPGAGDPESAFVRAILEREPVAAPFESGLAVLELTEAAYRSAASGGSPINITPMTASNGFG